MSEQYFGWTGYTWKINRRCVKCKRKITDGIVNINQLGKELEPSFKALCWNCWYDLPKIDPATGSESYTIPKEK